MEDQRTHVFVSYAHEDEAHRETLRRHLAPLYKWSQRADVWHDGLLTSTSEWDAEIRASLEKADVVIFLISDYLLDSDYVRTVEAPRAFERQRDNECRVVSVLVSDVGLADTPFAARQYFPRGLAIQSRPENMRSTAWREVADEVRAQLVDASARVSAEYSNGSLDAAVATTIPTAPTPPFRFVDRPELAELLRRELLAKPRRTAPVALVGMGGAGKTTLARAAATEAAMAQRYPGGVVWLELGPDPDVPAAQTELLAALGANEVIVDAGTGRESLRELLAARACLVVLDNVWRREDLRAFDLGESTSTLLVTTRSEDALGRGSMICRVDLVDADLARRILATWAAVDADTLPRTALKVVRRCCGLPLALAAAGGLVAEGRSWQAVLDLVKRPSRLSLRTRSAGYRHATLMSAFDGSVTTLPVDQRDRYLALAVTEGGGNVPVAVAHVLWQPAVADELASEEILVGLARRSLVRYDPESQTFGLHDLQIEYAEQTLGPDEVRRWHARLASAILASWGGIEAGLPRLAESDFGADPLEGYGLAHIVRHLLAAGERDTAYRLVALENRVGDSAENLWFDVQDRRGDTASYLRDVETLRRRAEVTTDQELSEGRPAAGVAGELRCALLAGSVASLAANVPIGLLCDAVQHGLWGTEQALTYARKMGSQRGEALADLVELLPEAQRRPVALEALAAARAGPVPSLVVPILLRQLEQWVTPQQHERLLDDLLAEARSSDVSNRPDHLQRVAAAFPAEQRREILLEAIADLDDSYFPPPRWRRADLLCDLAACLPEEERDPLYEQALAALRANDDEDGFSSRVERLVRFSTTQPEPRRSQRLAEARALAAQEPEKETRSRSLATIAEQLAGEQRESVAAEALALVEGIGEVSSWTLDALIPLVAPPLLSRLEALVRGLDDADERCRLLVALAERHVGTRRTQIFADALAAARSVDGRSGAADRGRCINLVANHMPEEQQDALLIEALRSVRVIGDTADRVRALAALAARLPDPRGAALGERAVELARDDPGWEALAGVAGELTGEDRLVVFAEVLDRLPASKNWEWSLGDVAVKLPAELVPRALELLDRLPADDHGIRRGPVLAAVIDHLPSNWTSEVLAALPGVVMWPSGPNALRTLLPRLNDHDRERLIQQIETMGWDESGTLARAAVAAYQASEGEPDAALRLHQGALRIADPRRRCLVLTMLLPDLPQAYQGIVLRDARGAASAIQDARPRTRQLIGLLRYFHGPEQVAVLEEAREAALAAGALITVATAAQEIMPTTWERYWRPALRQAAQANRAAIMRVVASAATEIARAGGSATVEAAIAILDDVAQWWP